MKCINSFDQSCIRRNPKKDWIWFQIPWIIPLFIHNFIKIVTKPFLNLYSAYIEVLLWKPISILYTHGSYLDGIFLPSWHSMLKFSTTLNGYTKQTLYMYIQHLNFKKINYLTSSIFKAKIGKPPDVAKTDTVPVSYTHLTLPTICSV